MTPARRGRAQASISLVRAGLCVAGLLLSGAPALAADTPTPAPTSVTPNHDPIPTVPGNPTPRFEPKAPQEPNPTGLQLPDEATARELKGQYGIGIGLLVLIGVVVAAALVGLVSLLLRRSWSARKS